MSQASAVKQENAGGDSQKLTDLLSEDFLSPLPFLGPKLPLSISTLRASCLQTVTCTETH